jgi:hypothetical protein
MCIGCPKSALLYHCIGTFDVIKGAEFNGRAVYSRRPATGKGHCCEVFFLYSSKLPVFFPVIDAWCISKFDPNTRCANYLIICHPLASP